MIVTAEPHSTTAPSAPPRARTPAPAPSGASPFEPCTPLAIAEGKNPLIDDFEDGDVRMPMVEHRAGQWYTFNDGTGSQLPKPGVLFSATRIPGGRGASRFGLHNQGGKFSKWGANLSLELNPRRCYDASAYGGIEFWTRGRGEIRVVVEMTHVITEEFGGSCTHDCFDGHGKRIKLSPDFQHVVVRWEELHQGGFGSPVPFDARSLYGIKFSVQASQTPFDFWIDDVSFSPR
jgi:licheninase